jgi:hypothetical protein
LPESYEATGMTEQSPSPEETSRTSGPPRAPLKQRLERAAAELNPLLIIFMIGLGLLDLTCYVGIEMSRGQTIHPPASSLSTTGPR